MRYHLLSFSWAKLLKKNNFLSWQLFRRLVDLWNATFSLESILRIPIKISEMHDPLTQESNFSKVYLLRKSRLYHIYKNSEISIA